MEENVLSLNNVDPLDLSDIFVKIENSFQIKFGSTELKDVSTFGELCDIIINKIDLQEAGDCSNQQAFYKFREAASSVLDIDKTAIKPDIPLDTLFPKRSRRKTIRQVEQILGYSMKALTAKPFIIAFFAVIFFLSFVALFISWKIGVAGILFSLLGSTIAYKSGREFSEETVAALVQKISREHYILSRRDRSTVNKNEIRQKVQELFVQDLGLDQKSLTGNASFN